jgi:hypothetical protein
MSIIANIGAGGGGDTPLAQMFCEAHAGPVGAGDEMIAMGSGNSVMCYNKYMTDFFERTTFKNEGERLQVESIRKNLFRKDSKRTGMTQSDFADYIRNFLFPLNPTKSFYQNIIFYLNKEGKRQNKAIIDSFQDGINVGIYNSGVEEQNYASLSPVDTYMCYSVGGISPKYITVSGESVTADNIRAEIVKMFVGLDAFFMEKSIRKVNILDVGGDIFDKITERPLEEWGRDEIMLVCLMAVKSQIPDLSINVIVIGPGCDGHRHPQDVVNKLTRYGFTKAGRIGKGFHKGNPPHDYGEKLYEHLVPKIAAWEANPSEHAEYTSLFQEHRALRIFYNSFYLSKKHKELKKFNKDPVVNAQNIQNVTDLMDKEAPKIFRGISKRTEKGFNPFECSPSEGWIARDCGRMWVNDSCIAEIQLMSITMTMEVDVHRLLTKYPSLMKEYASIMKVFDESCKNYKWG